MGKAKKLWQTFISKYSIFFILIVMIIICAFISPNFLKPKNLSNISRQISITTIIAFAVTLLIIAGMTDLSAGSVMALSGTISVVFFKAIANVPGAFWLAVVVSMAVGVFCNLINGFLVTKFRTPPFIATLAMQTMARGAALQITNGQNVYQIGNYAKLGASEILYIPTMVWLMLLVAVFTWYLLNHTRFGRYLYAVGGNEEAAKASGINIDKVKMQAYAIAGAFVGLTGVMFMSRNNGGMPNAGIGFEFEGMTAAIIGGTSFSGGSGTAAGTLVGAFIIGFLINIMNLMGVGSYVQQIVKGAIIVIAVAYDIYTRNRRQRSS